MFEAFSESARRVIFLARYEASRLKSEDIDVHHLLLGFILEDQGDALLHLRQVFGMEEGEPRNVPERESEDSFLDPATAKRLQAEFSRFGPRLESQPTSVDMPLTAKVRAALNNAFEHAGSGSVSPLHLLWGMIADEEDPVARSLIANRVTQESVDKEIRIRGTPGT